jgi:hypothetical protein
VTWHLTVAGAAEPAYSVIRRADGRREQLTVANRTARPLVLELSLEPDFAGGYRLVEHGRLVLGRSARGLPRETWVTAGAPDAIVTEAGFRFRVLIEPYCEWTTSLDARRSWRLAA